MYHKKNVDFAYLLWEDFVYHVEHKDAKKSNEMYYPRFTKVIVNFFMTKDQSIPRRNKVNWHFSRDDHMFTTIKRVSRHQKTQQYGAILPIKLTNIAIRNYESYKEYYAIASGAEPPKTKASVRKNLTLTHISHANGSGAGEGTDNDEDSHGMNVEGDEIDDEGANEKDNANELYRDVNINLEDILVTTTAELPLLSTTTLPPPPTPIIPTLQQIQVSSLANVPSSSLQDLSNFGSLFGFNHRLKALEINLSKFMHTNQFAEAISLIPGVVDKLKDEAQAENEDFLNKLNENIQKIIKEQVKEQVKAQVSKILPKIEKTVNEQLEAEVLTHSSNSSKTSHAVAANLSELELKKILIEKMERNKRREDEDKDEEPFAGSNRGSKRRRAGKEPESTSAPKEKTSKTTGKSIEGSKSHHKSASESAPTQEPMHTTKYLEEPAHQEFDAEVYKATTDQLDWNNPEGQQYPHDLRKLVPLIPTSRGLRVIPFDHFINNDLEYLRGGVSSRMYTTLVTKTKKADYGHIKWIEDLVPGKLTNLTVDECLAFNASLRMFTRSIVIQQLMEDLQLGVESYQNKINLIKPNTYRSDLKRKEAYTAYSSPRGFIYQNKDKQNRLMCINELHKFSDGTLNDVRTALDDRLKGIQMQYLP
nr:hypothetical protein [Tanacetum cinerariifolium]